MSIDSNLFKQVMAQWSSGITVITSTADANWQGITANSFASVSLNPPLVSVSIDKKLYIHSVIEQSGAFAANILNAEQVEWGKLFAGFFPEIEDRFAGIPCEIAVTGSPILPGVVGWVDCQVRHVYEAGDHTIFVGEVVAGGTPFVAPPLAYHSRSWGEFVRQMPDKVRIVEIGPGESLSIPAEIKIELIEWLVDAGLTQIRVGIFADQMPVPQLADTAQVYNSLQKQEGVIYNALVLDAKGLEQAHDAGFAHVDLMVSASDHHSQKTVNRSQAMEQFVTMASHAREYGMAVRGDILCAFGYRDAQDVGVRVITDIVRSFLDIGIPEIVLADSTGAANPLAIRKIVTSVLAVTGKTLVSIRLNNVYGLGLANMLAALEAGVTQFEMAFGGFGSSLLSKGEDSNIPTEDAIHMLQAMNIHTGVNLHRVARVSQRVLPLIGRPLPGKMYIPAMAPQT